ncbi:CGNR zinc finger domain-containing protein [Streptomyces sp. TS71-3]|uniref:CGNR zinc finger domain-containing protein n=1 Tax=Streptomyces sp. TS71-3 TaxID=2733862 RepID=UPI001BB39860|nr:CGNR zinc finger domain-containing protein [Streptomyces sp. TS71-3]
MEVFGSVHEDFLVDLLNMTPVLDGSPVDRLADDDGAREWLREHGSGASGADLRELRHVRDVLQGVVRGQEDPSSLQGFLAGAAFVPVVADAGVEWRLKASAKREAAVTAVLVWAHIQRTKPGRLRACANPECRRFLLDRSKPNSARWCSMAVCGNRMKARRHYARTKGAATAADVTG